MAENIYGSDSGIAVRNLTRENGDPSSYCYTSVIQNADNPAASEKQTVLIDLGRYESPEDIGTGEYNCVTPDVTEILKNDRPAALFLTHAHSDHVDGVFEYVHRAVEALKRGESIDDFKLPPVIASPTVIAMLKEGFSKRGLEEEWRKVLVLTPIQAGQTAVIEKTEYAKAVTYGDAFQPAQTAVTENNEVKIYNSDEVPPRDKLSEGALIVAATVAPHSIPDSLSFTLDNGAAKVFHSGDFRPDETSTLSQVVAGASEEYTYLANVMPVYKKEMIPTDCDMAVVDYGNGHTPGYARTEGDIVKNYQAVMEKDMGRELVALIQSNHVERMFSIVKAAIEQGRPVIIDGGTEMDLHFMSVLEALNVKRPKDAPELQLSDLFEHLQPEDPKKHVPVIYRAAHAKEEENHGKEVADLLKGTPAPVLIASGIYGETDPGATLYDALNGKYEGFPLTADADIIVTTDFNTFDVETFYPLQKLQQRIKNKEPMDSLYLDELPLNFRILLRDEYGISEENLWREENGKRLSPEDGKRLSWAQLRDMTKADFPKIEAELQKRLDNTPDIRGITVHTPHDGEPYSTLDGPGHGCAADIDGLAKLLGEKCHIMPVHTRADRKKNTKVTVSKDRVVEDAGAGPTVFVSKGKKPIVIEKGKENTILLSDRHFDATGHSAGEPKVETEITTFEAYASKTKADGPFFRTEVFLDKKEETDTALRLSTIGRISDNKEIHKTKVAVEKQSKAQMLAERGKRNKEKGTI